MSQQKQESEQKAKQGAGAQTKQQSGPHNPDVQKPESSSEYEGAPSRKPTGNEGKEVKTETSSSSGQ
jgi:hypothetical protein